MALLSRSDLGNCQNNLLEADGPDKLTGVLQSNEKERQRQLTSLVRDCLTASAFSTDDVEHRLAYMIEKAY